MEVARKCISVHGIAATGSTPKGTRITANVPKPLDDFARLEIRRLAADIRRAGVPNPETTFAGDTDITIVITHTGGSGQALGMLRDRIKAQFGLSLPVKRLAQIAAVH